ALWYVPPISSASSAIRNICAKPMHFITSSKKSEGISNSATPLRPILPIYIRSFIGAAYRRISRAPCATSMSRRTDGGGLPIYTAISFAPSVSQASRAHNGKIKAPEWRKVRKHVGEHAVHNDFQRANLSNRRLGERLFHDLGGTASNIESMYRNL